MSLIIDLTVTSDSDSDDNEKDISISNNNNNNSSTSLSSSTKTKTNLPFLVTGLDPGETAGAVACMDLSNGRLVNAKPFSLAEIIDDNLKRKPKLPTSNQLAKGIIRLLEHKEYSKYFISSRKVFMETQMKGHLKMIQVGLEVGLTDKCHISSMRSVRNYFGMSVTGQVTKRTKNKRRARRQAYEKRKKLSIDVVEQGSIIHKDDLKKLRAIAEQHWTEPERVQRYQLYSKTNKVKVTSMVKKAYSDMVEACLHALFPGNWIKSSLFNNDCYFAPVWAKQKIDHYNLFLKQARRRYSENSAAKKRLVLNSNLKKKNSYSSLSQISCGHKKRNRQQLSLIQHFDSKTGRFRKKQKLTKNK